MRIGIECSVKLPSYTREARAKALNHTEASAWYRTEWEAAMWKRITIQATYDGCRTESIGHNTRLVCLKNATISTQKFSYLPMITHVWVAINESLWEYLELDFGNAISVTGYIYPYINKHRKKNLGIRPFSYKNLTKGYSSGLTKEQKRDNHD